MIDVYPTYIEAVNEYNDVLFNVELQDGVAMVEILDAVNVQQWDEIAPLIRKCLVDMKLEGDNETKAP